MGANLAIGIIFIKAILVVNFVLIKKCLGIEKFWYKTRLTTLVSLALGDIILALFPLLLNAVANRWGLGFLTPELIFAIILYQYYLIPCVFGMGLVQLAVESVYRYRIKPNIDYSTCQRVMSTFLSFLPWLLGLAIVLPLHLVSKDCLHSPKCFGLTHHQLIYIKSACVLLSALLAVIACVSAMCWNQFSRYYQPLVDQTSDTEDSVSSTQISPHTALAENSFDNHPNQTATLQLTPISRQQTTLAQFTSSSTKRPPLKISPEPIHSNKQAQQVQMSEPHDQHHQEHNLSDPAPLIILQPTNNTVSEAKRERNVLVAVAILNFILVTPLQTFVIMVPFNYFAHALTDHIVLFYFLYWLSVLRSVVTPSIWIKYAR